MFRLFLFKEHFGCHITLPEGVILSLTQIMCASTVSLFCTVVTRLYTSRDNCLFFDYEQESF